MLLSLIALISSTLLSIATAVPLADYGSHNIFANSTDVARRFVPPVIPPSCRTTNVSCLTFREAMELSLVFRSLVKSRPGCLGQTATTGKLLVRSSASALLCLVLTRFVMHRYHSLDVYVVASRKVGGAAEIRPPDSQIRSPELLSSSVTPRIPQTIMSKHRSAFRSVERAYCGKPFVDQAHRVLPAERRATAGATSRSAQTAQWRPR